MEPKFCLSVVDFLLYVKVDFNKLIYDSQDYDSDSYHIVGNMVRDIIESATIYEPVVLELESRLLPPSMARVLIISLVKRKRTAKKQKRKTKELLCNEKKGTGGRAVW